MGKKILSIVVVICVLVSVLGAFPTMVFAASSGICGDNLTWTLDANGKLTIRGTGAMYDYTWTSIPWYDELKYNIKTIVVGSGVTYIGKHAFEDSIGLTKVVLNCKNVVIGDYAFNYGSSLNTVETNGIITSIGDSAFNYCWQLKTIDFKDGLLNIGKMAFFEAGLEKIEIPDTVTYIGNDAFAFNPSLKTIVFSDGMTELPDHVLGQCPELTSVTLPNKVTSIGIAAFVGCKSLNSIYLPKTIKNIGEAAFADTGLEYVHFEGSQTKWKEIAFDVDNECLTGAEITFLTDEDSVGKHDITIEVRDASTNRLIPEARITLYSNAKTAKFYTLWTGKITLEDVSFPIYGLGVFAQGYTYYRTLENVAYPDNGKIVLKLTSEKSQEVAVQGVYIFNKIDKLNIGETHHLEAQVSPLNATNKGITWSSSDTSVVTVDDTGLVTAVNGGTAVITAKASNGKSAKNTVTVNHKNILEYDKFKYSFPNDSDSFGYSMFYKIPKERYMQLGLPKSVAKKYVKKWGGSCFGMSVSSILFFKGILHEERYNNEVHTPSEFTNPDAGDYAFLSDKWEVKLRQMIELFQASQKLNWEGWNSDHINNIDEIIKQEIDAGNPVVLGLNGYKKDNKNETGGHAVVIYAYEETDIGMKLHIYDCSYFVDSALYADDYTDLAFHYLKDNWVWTFDWIILFDEMIEKYEYIYNLNSNDATSLFSLTEDEPYIYMIRDVGDITITNSNGIVSTVVNGELSGEIEGVKLSVDSYLSDNPQYTIILPAGIYTIVGTGEEEVVTTLADDYMSVDITAKTSTQITVSSDLHDVTISNKNEANYSVTYTTYDNLFDEMTISGVSYGEVQTTLNESNVIVSGAKTIKAGATRSEVLTEISAEIIDGQTATVVCTEDGDNNIQMKIASNEADITESVLLAERLQVEVPGYDVESGEYAESQILTLSKDDETIIYYTTDGSVPSEDNGILYTNSIEINQSVTIKAIATKYGYENSDILTLEYTLPEVTIPVPTLFAGEYDGVQQVELVADEGANIYYTIDGSDPLYSGELYTCPIIVTEDMTITAYAEINGCVSEVCEYSYTINEKPNVASIIIDGEELLFTEVSEAIAKAESIGETAVITLLGDVNVVDVECGLSHTIDLNGFAVGTLTVSGNAKITNGNVTNLYLSGVIETENVTVEETDASLYGVDGAYGIYTTLGIGVSVVDGAQVRIGSGVAEDGTIDRESGLRFICQNNTADTLSSIIINEYFNDEVYDDGYGIGVEITAEGSEDAVYIPATKWQDNTNSIFTVALTGLESNNFNRKFTARAYVEYNGIKIVDSESVTKSMYAVAAGLLAQSSDEDTERLIEVLNAYVNQTGIRLVLADNTLTAHDGSFAVNGAYTGDAFFTVGQTAVESNVYTVVLTPVGQNTKIDTENFAQYIRINNNNSDIAAAVTLVKNSDNTYTLVFDLGEVN